MTDPNPARAEAFRRYNGDVDAETGAVVDDWGYADVARSAFIAGVEWALSAPQPTEDEKVVAACDWSDFRKDYGVSPDDAVRALEHRAFLAGWEAGRHGDQSGAIR